MGQAQKHGGNVLKGMNGKQLLVQDPRMAVLWAATDLVLNNKTQNSIDPIDLRVG